MAGVNVAKAKEYLDALGSTPTADEVRAVSGDFDPADLLAAIWSEVKAGGGGGGSQTWNPNLRVLDEDKTIPADTSIVTAGPFDLNGHTLTFGANSALILV